MKGQRMTYQVLAQECEGGEWIEEQYPTEGEAKVCVAELVESGEWFKVEMHALD
jgi:hypothetical protein